MLKTIVLTAVLAMGSAATAQVLVGNPPGTSATEAVAAVPVPPTSSYTVVPAKTPAQLVADKYANEHVCKTPIETGSLIARRKACLTRKQWAMSTTRTSATHTGWSTSALSASGFPFTE